MSRARAAALAAFLLLWSCREPVPARAPDSDKPELHLLTALPLLWSERFSLDQPGSPALAALAERYRVTPVDLPSQLPPNALLLAAQPRALPAEELVALDQWVRGGGRLALLADPMLEWSSDLPLGDRRRPPLAYPDTGLLKHWGLRLDAPDERGPAAASIGGRRVIAVSPGRLVAEGGPCKLGDGGLTARCRIGKGEALVVADADFLKVGEASGDEGNLPALMSQLARMGR